MSTPAIALLRSPLRTRLIAQAGERISIRLDKVAHAHRVDDEAVLDSQSLRDVRGPRPDEEGPRPGAGRGGRGGRGAGVAQRPHLVPPLEGAIGLRGGGGGDLPGATREREADGESEGGQDEAREKGVRERERESSKRGG